MLKPRCIRIFKTYNEAMIASEALKAAGIYSRIKEDKFEKLTLKELGITPRFRLYIEQENILKAAGYLAKQIKKSRINA